MASDTGSSYTGACHPAADPDVAAEHIAAVRAFNRSYTRVVGALRHGVLGTDFSLTEARILFELATFGAAEVVDLRRVLDLDAGYLSRILTRFQAKDLIARKRSDVDARRQVVELTDTGRAVFTELDKRSQQDIGELLHPHSPAVRDRLVEAMAVIEAILDGENPGGTPPSGRADTVAAGSSTPGDRNAAPVTARSGAPVTPSDAAATSGPPSATARPESAVTLRDPGPGDHGWVIQRNGAVYAREFGWSREYEALVARIVADFLNCHEPHRERAWIAEHRGAPVGAVYCMQESPDTARLRVLLVEPTARGLGIGSTLVNACIDFATAAGYRELALWTTNAQTAARRIYDRAGFHLVQEDPQFLFGHNLLGQRLCRPLTGPPASR
ncbi:helix-turn-helix domain-containing GNAT family N-acetyltransferase [Nocardia sp. NPDC005978]|uniref:bifunctional helix-turn-helix transcriptional regulator/GNAT family N-acetyltransferase n=1 Tax=Nocardia sp. NPDC005978 TaxID=3156725 RepID=UPI0033B42B6C